MSTLFPVESTNTSRPAGGAVRGCVGTVLLLAGLFYAAAPATAQNNVRVGPEFAYEFGLPLGINRNPGAVEWCRCTGSGTSYSHALWTGVQITGLFEGPLDIVERLSVGRATGSFTSEPYPMLLGANTAQARFTVTAGAWHVREEIALAWKSQTPWSGEIGLSLLYRMGGTFELREQLTSPSNAVFPNDGTNEHLLQTGESLAGARLRAGAVAGASYTIPFNDVLSLVPALHIRGDFEGLRLGLGLRSFSVAAGVALHFATQRPLKIIDTVVTTIPPDTVRVPTDPGSFKATLDIYARDSAGARAQQFIVRNRSMRYRRVMQLAPAIFFDEKSAAFPSRYMRLAPDQTQQFTMDSLARLDVPGLHAHTLNIAALRLREHIGVKLVLFSPASGREPRGLSAARVEAVRDYLVDVWRIAPERITIDRRTTTAQANGAYPAVHLTFTGRGAEAMLSPVVTDWEEQGIEAPQIGVQPRFTGGAGMRQWEITVRHLGREVLHCSSDGTQQSHDLNVSLRSARDDNSEALSPLVAELIAEDSSGTLSVARDRLPVALDTTVLPARYVEVIYTIPVHDGLVDRAMLGLVAARLTPGDRVRVEYADDRIRTKAAEIAGTLRPHASSMELEQYDAGDAAARAALWKAAYGTPVTVIVQHGLDNPPR